MKHVKLLKEIYKTWEGANKRCGFENAVARGEFERGDKARFYRYTIIKEGEMYRVARCLPDSPLERLRHHVTGCVERGEKRAIVEKR